MGKAPLMEHSISVKDRARPIRQPPHRLGPEKEAEAERQSQVRYLGHIVSSKGVATDPAKVEVVEQWPVPRGVQELQGFLGTVGTGAGVSGSKEYLYSGHGCQRVRRRSCAVTTVSRPGTSDCLLQQNAHPLEAKLLRDMQRAVGNGQSGKTLPPVLIKTGVLASHRPCLPVMVLPQEGALPPGGALARGAGRGQLQAGTPYRIKALQRQWLKQTDLQRLSTLCPDRIPPAREAAGSWVRPPVSTETAKVNSGLVEAILGSPDIEPVMTRDTTSRHQEPRKSWAEVARTARKTTGITGRHAAPTGARTDSSHNVPSTSESHRSVFETVRVGEPRAQGLASQEVIPENQAGWRAGNQSDPSWSNPVVYRVPPGYEGASYLADTCHDPLWGGEDGSRQRLYAGRPWQKVDTDLDVIAIPEATDPVVASALDERVFCYLGLPEQIHTDQGAQFESQLMEELWKVSKTWTTPYHPQANGIVERNNRCLGDSLRAMLLERGQEE
ncbi:uncharacterized protein [Watersipora subatra]|uniref:uncharacterized protein n=1 Tax=Watersipora subatra TaxID=2589382 RepID=UPI00355C7539